MLTQLSLWHKLHTYFLSCSLKHFFQFLSLPFIHSGSLKQSQMPFLVTMANKYCSVCQRNSVAELTLGRGWLTGHSCCQCRFAKQKDFTQFLRSGRALPQKLPHKYTDESSELKFQGIIQKSYFPTLCLKYDLLTVASSALNLLMYFLCNHLWLILLQIFTCPFTAWQGELCSSPDRGWC